MFSHIVVGCNDADKSFAFYDALFTAVGGKPGSRITPEKAAYMHNGGLLMVTRPLNGEPATHANGGTIGLAMASPEQVDAWHAAGVAAGGTTCEDPPGKRDHLKMYLAYLRDPAGNKLCAMYRYPA
ncbi:VOC family protein [Novosphingobium bradum]|uniref:VOC family protein n=1 Tax=Novosphingobium bradum TaxID=1737444 RepID=A0ABV7IR12_9SPHN